MARAAALIDVQFPFQSCAACLTTCHGCQRALEARPNRAAIRQLIDRDGGAKPTPTTTSIVLEGSAETEQLSVLLLSFFARSWAVDFGTPAVSHGFGETAR